MKKIITLALALSISISSIPQEVKAWGPAGHRVAGRIAMDYITDKTREKITEILGHPKNDRLDVLSTIPDEFCADNSKTYPWLDLEYDAKNKKLTHKEVTRDYTTTRKWHHISLDDHPDYVTAPRHRKGDIYTAIHNTLFILHQADELLKEDARVLEEEGETSKNKDKNKEMLKASLAWLSHLVGDLHQPLHVGNSEDRGGTRIKVKTYRGEKNIHSLWDSGILNMYGMSYSELYTKLKTTLFLNEEENTELTKTCVMDWMLETRAHAKNLAYKVKENERLPEKYIHDSLDLIEKQLFKAGYRLAYLLNNVFDFEDRKRCEIDKPMNKHIHRDNVVYMEDEPPREQNHNNAHNSGGGGHKSNNHQGGGGSYNRQGGGHKSNNHQGGSGNYNRQDGGHKSNNHQGGKKEQK